MKKTHFLSRLRYTVLLVLLTVSCNEQSEDFLPELKLFNPDVSIPERTIIVNYKPSFQRGDTIVFYQNGPFEKANDGLNSKSSVNNNAASNSIYEVQLLKDGQFLMNLNDVIWTSQGFQGAKWVIPNSISEGDNYSLRYHNYTSNGRSYLLKPSNSFSIQDECRINVLGLLNPQGYNYNSDTKTMNSYTFSAGPNMVLSGDVYRDGTLMHTYSPVNLLGYPTYFPLNMWSPAYPLTYAFDNVPTGTYKFTFRCDCGNGKIATKVIMVPVVDDPNNENPGDPGDPGVF